MLTLFAGRYGPVVHRHSQLPQPLQGEDLAAQVVVPEQVQEVLLVHPLALRVRLQVRLPHLLGPLDQVALEHPLIQAQTMATQTIM
jgi:hypothetical protein